ncbi:MAG: alcohol dehydrogenase catalytic domain-containing protein [Deltaproteobacteria bacterium]|nr:alcohol dehydrogenase catalytic domain-containing protein [Deltaproteobacteria bacterium]
MKAIVLRSGELRVDEVADPVPETGQVLVKSLACSICASDHHMIHHGDRLAAWSRANGGMFNFDPDQDLVLGHEFCGEIVDHGPGADSPFAVGTRVVSSPVLLHRGGMAVLGYSNVWPGGFGEYLALSESMLLAVPDHVPSAIASLMEPLSVGIQYVRIADVQPGEVPLVIGCGAIGLSVVAAMKAAGIAPIVAADYSPFRRETAVAAGATDVVDPAVESAVGAWHRVAPPGSGCVIVECVGAPGVLNDLFAEAPTSAQIIVAGQNLQDDTIFTASAHAKGLKVQFGGIPVPADYENSLAAIASGAIDITPWQTGNADLDGAIDAFKESTDTERHTRIAVHPHGLEAAGL